MVACYKPDRQLWQKNASRIRPIQQSLIVAAMNAVAQVGKRVISQNVAGDRQLGSSPCESWSARISLE